MSNVDDWFIIINRIDVIKISDATKPVMMWHFAPVSPGTLLFPFHKQRTYAARKISILIIEKHERKPLKHAQHETIELVHLFKYVEMSWNDIHESHSNKPTWNNYVTTLFTYPGRQKPYSKTSTCCVFKVKWIFFF